MADLDLTKIHLGTTGIAGFALKRDALKFAKDHGWKATDATRAFNRFSLFWVVAQSVCGEIRIIRTDGSLFVASHPGFK